MSNRAAATLEKPASLQLKPASSGLLQRQCACGNHTVAGGECSECAKKKSGLQRQLTIGASNDPMELEADRVADQIMASLESQNITHTKPILQRYSSPTSKTSVMSADIPSSVNQVLASSGRPLEPVLRHDMESRFGRDFSHVRIHTGGNAEQSAKEVNAKAYTVGNNVVFGAGKYAPNTRKGRHLLAHELTHVVQQQINSNGSLQRGIDQLELEKCMASLGDTSKQGKGFIVDRPGGIANEKEIEQYEKECIARQVERQRQKQSKLDDLLLAVGFSIELIPGAVKMHAGEMAEGLLDGLIEFAKDAAKILAASTAVGALIGAIVGAGAGAIPGAEIGFEVGLKILEIYGLAMLIKTIIEMAGGFISNLGQFLDLVFHANGDKDQLKKAANNLAEAIGILVSALLMALLAYLLKKGTERILESKFAKTIGESRLSKWFKERANKETSKKLNQPEPSKKAEGPKPKDDQQTKKSDQSSEHVKIEESSLDDTRKVQVTEDGGCKVCASPCDKIRNKYSEELAKHPEINSEIGKIEKSTSSLADKEKQYKIIDQRLADIRLKSFSNGAKLQSEGWIGKKIKVGEALPEGYSWNDGKIFRKPGKVDANYTPLEISEKSKLKVRELPERLSNPSTMKTNFKNALTEKVKTKNPEWEKEKVKAEVEKQLEAQQIHHLLPDEAIKNHPLGKAAREAGYNLDRSNNLKGLAKNKELMNIDTAEPGHWSNHPEYTQQVKIEMSKTQMRLEQQYKTTIDKVPKFELLKEMERLENLFRGKIERSNVPMKDGRLSEITPATRNTQDEESYA